MGRILFCMESVRMGGSATSLLNLLDFLKKYDVEVDLFLFENEGIFIDRARRVVNLLPESRILASIRCNKEKLKKKGFLCHVIRCIYVLTHKIIGVEKANKLFYKICANRFYNKYDAVISYQEQIPTEFVQYIHAKRKLAWCHMDYNAFRDNKSIEYHKKLYSNYDDIICVSDVVRDSMIKNLNLNPLHIHKIYNTIPSDYITKCASEKIEIETRKFTFVSVGRFVKRKGFDRVVMAAEYLKHDNIPFIWYVLGDGVEFDNISSMIKERNLENDVLLTGAIRNPYPYIKVADAYVMTSINEAQPMVMNEALTLGVPVISTSFGSAKEIVTDGLNGIINDNSLEGVICGLLRFINDENLRSQISTGANAFVYDNCSIVERILGLVLGKKNDKA